MDSSVFHRCLLSLVNTQQLKMASRTSAVSIPREEDTDSQTVTTFISKVWKIVEKPEYNHLITWSQVNQIRVYEANTNASVNF